MRPTMFRVKIKDRLYLLSVDEFLQHLSTGVKPIEVVAVV